MAEDLYPDVRNPIPGGIDSGPTAARHELLQGTSRPPANAGDERVEREVLRGRARSAAPGAPTCPAGQEETGGEGRRPSRRPAS